MKFAICVGRFYEELAERLLSGALAALPKDAETEVFDVPGAYELPMAAKLAADSARFDGVICLGAVIRGETSHYDYVCSESARGIQQVQLETGVPCSFGVLTVDDYDQALARSGAPSGEQAGKRDTGAHAAEAVLALIRIKERLA
jgi:6,7-dimethyl-8-ribityllumazine synthase